MLCLRGILLSACGLNNKYRLIKDSDLTTIENNCYFPRSCKYNATQGTQVYKVKQPINSSKERLKSAHPHD